MIENNDVTKVLEKLESLEDEELAVKLLKEFNDATKELGVLILNKDESLTHEDWKSRCDSAQKKVEEVVQKIEEL
tara:strand:+ start:123498 stop:123722 length:225 start_codon:yes stop_codon:yes gene_type:complete